MVRTFEYVLHFVRCVTVSVSPNQIIIIIIILQFQLKFSIINYYQQYYYYQHYVINGYLICCSDLISRQLTTMLRPVYSLSEDALLYISMKFEYSTNLEISLLKELFPTYTSIQCSMLERKEETGRFTLSILCNMLFQTVGAGERFFAV